MFRRFQPRPRPAALLRVEPLEGRDVPSVTLASIPDQQMASTKPLFVPVTVTNSPSGSVVTTVTTNNPGVTATVLSNNRSVKFDVSGGTGSGAFTGSITVQLFEQAAPNNTQRIIDLVNSGYYTSLSHNKFFRVEDLLTGVPDTQTQVIIQGGGGDGFDNSPRGSLDDEFSRDYTFASNGLLAMANSGADTNNSQFFFTDLNRPVSDRFGFGNFRYTIVGIVTAGFDVIQKIQNAPRTGSSPDSPITVVGASVLQTSPNAVIELKPTAGGFLSTTAVTVTSTDSSGPTTTTFNVTGVADASNSRPFLGPLASTVTTTAGTPYSFTVPYTDIDGDAVTFAVRDGNFSKAPSNVTVAIDQTTGKVTLTPAAGYTGPVTFKVGVKNKSTTTDNDSAYDTQLVTLNVTAAPPPTTPPTVPPTSPPTTVPPTSPPTTVPPTTVPPTSPPTTVPPTTVPPTVSGDVTATGSPAGSEPRLVITNADGSERFNILAYEPSFTGGVNVLMADVNGDGRADAVVAPGAGGSSLVKVYDTSTGQVLFSQMVFEDSFRGGVSVATGDVTGLGRDQILIGAGSGGGPRVTLLDVVQNKVLLNFFAYDSGLRGGVSVALAELKAGKGADIVTAAGPGGGPQVSVYVADTGNLLGTTFVGNANDRAGVQVRVGDVDAATGERHLFVRKTGGGMADETEVTPSTFVDFDSDGTPQGSAVDTNSPDIQAISKNLLTRSSG